MAKFCFFSFEIFPTVKGGAGVLLFNAARQLLPQGHEVIFVLDLPKEEFDQFDQVDRLTLPNPEHCRAYFVWGMVQDMKVGRPEFQSVYEYRSYQFHHVAQKVYELEKPDVIEFFEYTGSAYYALNAKALGLAYQETNLAVRLHGSLEMIDRMQSSGLVGIDRYLMYGLERQALRLAETVLTPSQTFLDQAYRPYYEPWYGEAVVSQPPLVGWPQPEGSVADPRWGAVLWEAAWHQRGRCLCGCCLRLSEQPFESAAQLLSGWVLIRSSRLENLAAIENISCAKSHLNFGSIFISPVSYPGLNWASCCRVCCLG